MEEIFPRHLQTKEGEFFQIRIARIADAAALLSYINVVGGESDFLTFGSGEFKKTIDEERAIIKDCLDASNQLFLIAELNGEIAGILDVKASQKQRLKHIGMFGISVRKAYWGKGIGAQLIQALLDWAKISGVIRKINLGVLTQNESAIKLYEKFGFEKEGLIRRDGFLHGRFNDTYCMGILID